MTQITRTSILTISLVALLLFIIIFTLSNSKKIVENAEVQEENKAVSDEYLYDCYSMGDENKKVICFESYYLSKNHTLLTKKDNCKMLNEINMGKCLDEYYMELASETTTIFCIPIRDDNLRNVCSGLAK